MGAFEFLIVGLFIIWIVSSGKLRNVLKAMQ